MEELGGGSIIHYCVIPDNFGLEGKGNDSKITITMTKRNTIVQNL